MNTLFLLMAEYGTGEVLLSDISKKYFGLSIDKAAPRAKVQLLPVPVYRGGSQKSEWLVSLSDLAEWLDEKKEQARHDWDRINAA